MQEKRHPEEKVGIVGRVDGKLQVVEYSELSREDMYAKNDDGSLKYIYLLILNAGNFHNPKVCSRGAGFEIKELDNLRFNVSNRAFEACSLYCGRG